MGSNDRLIRPSPYEPGLYFVDPEPGTTLQSIGTMEWKVGERYTLHKVLGYGGFSCVCLATDNATGELVAVKRIGDVMHSVEHAKRVLREIAILRRVSHPNLISLRDAFVRPSATGQCRMVGGRLVHTSIDLYLALEYADGGDLFHMHGQLSPAEVTSLLWQLVQAVAYLHSLDVWHRDVKSQNAFITWEHGVRVVKLGDFGSARSAISRQYRKQDSGGVPSPDRELHLMHTADSYKEMEAAMHSSDLYAQPVGNATSIGENNRGTMAMISGDRNAGDLSLPPTRRQDASSGGGGGGFRAPLTRVVATPCYRAPEVVMSRGGYSAPIDMWGVGCVFGELLQRVAYVGSAATPHLQVAPLFAIRGMPKTPEDGETFGRPECVGTRRELQALFDVVGTPAWSDAAAVEMGEWRGYLGRLPGKAPSLYRRFKAAGEVAVHLLSRLLEFDPRRRATCEEALSHEFFESLRTDIACVARGTESSPSGTAANAMTVPDNAFFDTIVIKRGENDPPISGSDVGMEETEEDDSPEGGMCQRSRADSLAVDAAAAMATRGVIEGTVTTEREYGTKPIGMVTGYLQHAQQPAASVTNFWQEANPGRALAMLELELEDITLGGASETDPTSEGCQHLRKLLEAECNAVSDMSRARVAAGPASTGTPPRPPSRPAQEAAAGLSGMFRRRGTGLQEDTAATEYQGGAKDYGKDRLSNVADTWQGRELDPRKFLHPQRHGEWTAQGGGGGPAPGPRWGVTAVPPGLEGNVFDPRVQAIMKQQQQR